MFGFSLTKLLFTIAAVIVAWNGFKWYTRMQERRAAGVGDKKPRPQAGSSAGNPTIEAEDMVKCPVCETYVSQASAVSCGKDGCPYPG